MFKYTNLLLVVGYCTMLFMASVLTAQTFTRLTVDQENAYTRAGWFDYDNDNDLDLFIGIINVRDTTNSGNKLYRNDGGDVFVPVTIPGAQNPNTFTTGISFADYDNNGQTDIFLSNINTPLTTTIGSYLVKNQTGGDFEIITTSDIAAGNNIFSPASSWADYDNDGDVDLYFTTSSGSVAAGDTMSNVLFDNNGDGTFTKNTSSAIVNGDFDLYFTPTWSDYDQDGDMDLYVSLGPASGNFVQDHFYVNMLVETGSPDFVRSTAPAFASDTHDGQGTQFIDYDNDGDLDAYLINWGGAPPAPPGSPPRWPGTQNELYRNDGSGVYTKVTTGNIVTDIGISNGQIWGDFDNDGDLDAYVSNNTSALSFGGNRLYQNSGFPNYTFSSVALGDPTATGRGSFGGTMGDYDNDGDLDLYIMLVSLIGQPALDALYRNDTNNGNSWIKIQCVGMQSNKSAIGTKLRAKATVFGNTYWQMREITNKVTFGSPSSLQAHFGLGDATILDSLVIEWPSGVVDTYTAVGVNTFYNAVEGTSFLVTSVEDGPLGNIPEIFALRANYPNPFNPSTTIEYDLAQNTHVVLKIYNVLGRKMRTLVDEGQPAGVNSVVWDGRNEAGAVVSSGIYIYKIETRAFSASRKMVFIK